MPPLHGRVALRNGPAGWGGGGAMRPPLEICNNGSKNRKGKSQDRLALEENQ